MNLSPKNKIVLIFAGLMGMTLVAFQNCSSSSLFLFGSANKARATTQISDMLEDSEKEVKQTQKEFESVSVPSKIIIRKRVLANEPVTENLKESQKPVTAIEKDLKIKFRVKKIHKKNHSAN